jgi:hypothetical protein
MIIGRDILHSLNINLLFDTAEITWDNAKIHMQPPDILKEDWVENYSVHMILTQMDAEQIQGIIESKYPPADLSKIVEECTHLEKAEQKQLLKLLQRYEDLFDGSLGTWKTASIQFCLIRKKRQ